MQQRDRGIAVSIAAPRGHGLQNGWTVAEARAEEEEGKEVKEEEAAVVAAKEVKGAKVRESAATNVEMSAEVDVIVRRIGKPVRTHAIAPPQPRIRRRGRCSRPHPGGSPR